MRSDRRATEGSPWTQPRTLVSIGAIIAAFSLIAVLVSAQSGESEASQEGAPVAAGAPRDGSGSRQAASSGRTGAAGEPEGESGLRAVTELEKTFLVKVRQAGLWEIPAGRLAQTHGSSEAVKRAGLHLIDGHSKLDQLVREDAKILGVQLPNEASEEQQGWVAQMRNANGAEFDRLFANLLRSSHGKIFATIAEVRAGTQNDLIRRHAREANQTVLDHLEVLEDSGLVDPETLAEVAEAVTA